MSGVLAELEAGFDYGQGVHRRGLGYCLYGDDENGGPSWEVSVNRLRRSGGELRGELRVLADGRHVVGGSFNLSSLAARGATAKVLHQREPKLPWVEILERVCVCVLAREAEGAPVEMIGKRRQVSESARLLPPLLPEGHPSIIFGPGGAGKSTLAAGIAVSVATGAQVIGNWSPPRPRRVAILDWEASAADWSNVVAGIAEGASVEPPEIPYIGCGRPLADDVERLAEATTQHQVEAVVVDSMGLALGAGREAQDPADAVLRLYGASGR
ncbi:MAG: AAA family ATPase [Candidatus Dormibacterales bacterium]